MTSLYVVVNESGHYLGKQQQWLDGSEPQHVFRSEHRDEAVNAAFEAGLRDVTLRAQVSQVEANERKLPILDISDIPLPNSENSDDEADAVLEKVGESPHL